jgi:hypothetical protein
MNAETENNNLTEILKSTPPEEYILRTDSPVLEIMLHDNTEFSLEALSEQEKETIDIHFVGRSHGEKTDQSVYDEIANFKPQLIICESTAANRVLRNNLELTQATNVLSFDLEITIKDKLKPTWIRPSTFGGRITDMSGIIPMIKDSSLRPILRLIDLPRDELSLKTGTEYKEGSGSWAYNTLNLLANMETSDIDDLSASNPLSEALNKDATTAMIRDDAMTEEISCIVANMRKKAFNPSLKVVVITGGLHTDILRDNISQTGVNVTSVDVDEKDGVKPLNSRIDEEIMARVEALRGK